MNCLDRLPAALVAVAPLVDIDVWTHALHAPMESSGIVTPYRAAMFLGQCAEESGGFTVMVENLEYSANGLRREWPSHFAPTPMMPSAEPFAYQPEMIANWVYANRNGNGPTSTGDGWRFRGGGIIQGTGRAFWERFGASVHRSADDAWTWAQTPEGAAAAACWYWLDRGQLLALSDGWDIEAVTRRINGGDTNLEKRIALCERARDAFEGTAAPAAPAPAPMSEADALMQKELDGTLQVKPEGQS